MPSLDILRDSTLPLFLITHHVLPICFAERAYDVNVEVQSKWMGKLITKVHQDSINQRALAWCTADIESKACRVIYSRLLAATFSSSTDAFEFIFSHRSSMKWNWKNPHDFPLKAKIGANSRLNDFFSQCSASSGRIWTRYLHRLVRFFTQIKNKAPWVV